MIVDNGIYYLYRHIRLDNNLPFYVGIGKKPSDAKHDTRAYRRALSSKNRNRQWYFIANKTGFAVEIILESDSSEFIKSKEKEFVSIYGRNDLNLGTLCNFTNGGDGYLNRSKESTKLQLDTAQKNGTLDVAIERVKPFRFKPGEATRNKTVFLYSNNGDYIKSFNSMYECSLYIGCSTASISVCIKNRSHYNGFLFSLNKVDKLDTSIFVIKSKKYKQVSMICPSDLSVIGSYNSIIEAEKSTKVNSENISRSLRLGCKTKGFFWVYTDDISRGFYLSNNNKITWQQ